jgi:hypothetical protein
VKVVNLTPFAVALYRTALVRETPELDWEFGTPMAPVPEAPREPDQMHNALVVCVRYPIRDGRLAAPVADVQRPTTEPDLPEDAGYGVLLEPSNFPRAGTDVIVLGEARSAAPVEEMGVRVSVGPYDVRMHVTGDRVWERHGKRLVPGRPAPFVRMPLTLARAYGGRAPNAYGEMPYAANPEGRGYFLDEEGAVGGALPNVELPDARVRTWEDQPEPISCGPYPPSGSLRLDRCTDVQEDGTVVVHPERGLLDQAHPRLSGRRVEGGVLRLEGMDPDGVLAWDVPACPVVADIRIGSRGGVRPLTLEEIVVDLPRGHVDLTWRKGFTYTIIPHERRRTVVRLREV